MIKDDGIRTLVPGVVLESEIKEIQDAREYIRKKLGIRNELRAAPTTLISDYLPPTISVKLPAETKDEYGYTASQNKEIEKQLTKDTSKSKGAWKRFVKANQEAEKKDNELRRKKQLMRSWGLDKEKQKDNSSVKYVGTRSDNPAWVKDAERKQLENSKILRNNINNLKKEEVILDPQHPDGFRFAKNNDLYKNYGDTPVRYIQEVRYKYKDGPAPTDSIVKKFDSFDSSTFPADPEQKKALAKYQIMYNKLSPLQKKQLETAQNTKKQIKFSS